MKWRQYTRCPAGLVFTLTRSRRRVNPASEGSARGGLAMDANRSPVSPARADRDRGHAPSMLLIYCAMFTAMSVARAADWPAWRGPQGTGVAADQPDLPLTWSDKENV